MVTVDSVWTPESELALYLSMVGLRPIGIHKHFRLFNIYTRLQYRLGKTDISLGDVKSRIGTLFNIPLLDEIEDDYEDEEESEKSLGDNTTSKPNKHPAVRVQSGHSDSSNIESGDESNDDDGDESGGKPESARISNTEIKGGAKDGDTANIGEKIGLSSFIPPTSIGMTLDTSDPDFWRKANAEFSLPWSDFGALMVERARLGVAEDKDDVYIEADADAASNVSDTTSVQKVESPEREGQDAGADMDHGSNEERTSPIGSRRRRGRSSTPVQRSRTKVTRSSAPSARKRQRTR
ncbi:CT20-domain-containing protein [Coemansia reversa NRRL 1564]|uniref:CT20-domain-containing protein n=1 Tax=Coemansia reversa (strain ATCC 12441 / NRRL 1564) TaxID=763665 RepID=A0A2G5BBC9_COERN|nr:CT20-domain-containing protein [Coemansia reversa NRRL 1564]|eukprot:PIA16310.1 CT20-domain-containing protein [Coemansia reversa NRRL 1564]